MSYSDSRAEMVGWDPHAAMKHSWRYIQNVVKAAFEYGPDRDTSDEPAAPRDDVRVRVGNPTQNQIAVAASSFGYRSTDKVITIWSDTLRENPKSCGSERIVPLEDDRIDVGGIAYRIKSLKEAEYDTQYVCYCRRLENQAPTSGS